MNSAVIRISTEKRDREREAAGRAAAAAAAGSARPGSPSTPSASSDIAAGAALQPSCGQQSPVQAQAASVIGRICAARLGGSTLPRAAAPATPCVAVFAQLVAQGADRDAEDGRRMGAVAERVAQRVDDQVALDLGHGAADQAAGRAGRRPRCGAAAAALAAGSSIASALDRRRPAPAAPRGAAQFSSSRTLPGQGMRQQPRQRRRAERRAAAGRWPGRSLAGEVVAPAPRCRPAARAAAAGAASPR